MATSPGPSASSRGRPLSLGVVALADTGVLQETFGETTAGSLQRGTDHLYVATGPDDLTMTIADTSWDTGERDIRTLMASGPPQIGGLQQRLRLSVRQIDQDLATCDLRQARVKLNTEPMWSSLYQADSEAHRLATGVDIVDVLGTHGALAGTRGCLLDDRSRQRNGWCTLFPQQAALVPVIAYVVTRVIPVLNMVFVPASVEFTGYRPPDRARHESVRRIYVVLLSADAGTSPDPVLPPVYVGQTGKPRADRFREHLIGHRSSSKVRHHGIRLMPELYPQTGRITSNDEATELEASWAQQLRVRGHLVHGGH